MLHGELDSDSGSQRMKGIFLKLILAFKLIRYSKVREKVV